jgi:hypothetical protein
VAFLGPAASFSHQVRNGELIINLEHH